MFREAKHFFILNLLVLTPTFGNKKYDIEGESVKLYGEDFKSVLQGFRRSSEYLHILEDEMYDFHANLNNIQLAVLTKYVTEMGKKIEENFTSAEDAAKKPDLLRQNPKGKVSGLKPAPNPPLNKKLRVGDFVFGNHDTRTMDINIGNGQVFEDHETTTETGVKRLEARARGLIPQLPHDDQIAYRNMGYEYAGKAIHALIKAVTEAEGIEGEDEVRSTRLPGGGVVDDKQTPGSTVHEEHTVLPKVTEVVKQPPQKFSTKHDAPKQLRKIEKHKG